MAAPTKTSATFGQLPDLSGLSEAERLQVIAVMERAKDFEKQEELKNAGSPPSRKQTEGQLLKYTNVMKGWQHRYFVLDPESGMLEYFEKEEHKKQRPRGSVHLAAAVISPSDEDGQTFTVNAANGEIYRLRALDARGRQHWVDRLRATAEHHTETIAQKKKKIPGLQAPPITRRDSSQSISSQQPKDNLLVRRLDSTLSKKVHSDVDDGLPTTMTVRSQHKALHPSRQDSFKEVKEYISESDEYSKHLAGKISNLSYTSGYLTGVDKDLLLLKATSSATIHCLEQCLAILQSTQPHPLPPSHPADRKPTPLDVARTPGQLTASSPAESYTSASSIPYTFADQKIEDPVDHDTEVEDEAEYRDSELGGVEEHKSIILHLLSQLKLGMDLTKVVLPTFILEKRSLLEMFADCMAHPDSFLKIPSLADPEQRMLAVLEWYLTSFHVGRQGSVAKKPYNPIIGETFHCSWRIPEGEVQVDSDSGSEEEAASDAKSSSSSSPSYTQLVYTAEQVSHHPPVSAFYFECPEKQMCMNASIWTKSKFMGMSIGVVMVGKVRLQLLSHGEEYVFSLPSAYARSILTVPWVELGDRITISCDKTGYSSSVVFHTKPFYGGKLHRVSAEVKNNTTGVACCKVQGEWNSLLEFTYADDQTKTIDVQQLNPWHKRVRLLAQQGEFESRRLWQHVTNALKINDVNTATEHKRFLEERQREGERHRKETNTAFPTKFFHSAGESWVYNNMLKKSSSEDVQ